MGPGGNLFGKSVLELSQNIMLGVLHEIRRSMSRDRNRHYIYKKMIVLFIDNHILSYTNFITL